MLIVQRERERERHTHTQRQRVCEGHSELALDMEIVGGHFQTCPSMVHPVHSTLWLLGRCG
jgi:hypothetical protein